jgi:predicted MFS family arabinose efflux permease
VNSLTSTAVILGPVLGGAMVTTYGPEMAFVVSGSLMFMLGIGVLFIRCFIEKRDQVVTLHELDSLVS